MELMFPPANNFVLARARVWGGGPYYFTSTRPDPLTDPCQFDILVFGPIPAGGSDAIRSTNSTRVHDADRRRCGDVAARGARAAASAACDWIPQRRGRRICALPEWVPPGAQDGRIHRGSECCDRIPL